MHLGTVPSGDLTADGWIDIFDINRIKPVFFSTCSP